MSSNAWPTTQLSKAVSLQRGHDLPSADRRSGSVPVIGWSGLSGYHDVPIIQGPGVTVGRSGSLGVVTWVQQDYWPLNTVLYATDFHGNAPRFIYYMLRSLDFRGYNSGSVQPSLNRNFIASVEVPVPPVAEQVRIANSLGALDDMIDLNGRTSSMSYTLRQAVLDEEFADKPRLAKLSDLATFVNGRNFTAHANGIGRPIIRIRELTGGIDPRTPRSSIDADRDNIAEPDTLLLAWSGSVGAHRWYGEESLINQHIFKVEPKAPAWLVQYWLDKHVPWFRSIAADKATTMGHIQRHHLDEALCAMPDDIALVGLNKKLGPLFELERGLAAETATLTELRDALLPELISGRMTVN